jgi:uncharacterized membrane protein
MDHFITRRSFGQAYRFSRSATSIRQPSIVQCLASRALTGRHLLIEVHQPYGLKVHLIWDFDRDGVTFEACLSRAYVYVGDVIHLGLSLQHYTLVGMCTCVCEGVAHQFWDKVEQCFRAP